MEFIGERSWESVGKFCVFIFHMTEFMLSVISWVSSPLLAGLMAITFYVVVKYTVLKRVRFYCVLQVNYFLLPTLYFQNNQFEASLTMMPFFYLFALTINIFAVTYDGSKCNSVWHMSYQNVSQMFSQIQIFILKN